MSLLLANGALGTVIAREEASSEGVPTGHRTAQLGRAERSVAGLYVGSVRRFQPDLRRGPQQGIWFTGTEFYLLSEEGRVYRGNGLPNTPGDDARRFDYARAQRLDPGGSGSYSKRGSDLTIRLGSPTSFTLTGMLTPAGDLEILGTIYKHFDFSIRDEAESRLPSKSNALPVSAGRQKTPVGTRDVNYHARPIPSKERDVPLEAYVHAGLSFRPTYGGVGTAMTWSQKVATDVLLLFTNGVAARVDLEKGNLAGHYQAEGFASMDVSEPEQFTSPPYGRWQESDGAISVAWNNGKSEEFRRDGRDLIGPEGKWTPFHMAEGLRLEGSYQRESVGGRPRTLMLRKDGTFTADGVNITMGGNIVNPQFPERGSGTYEFHKGSLILRFDTGFTQAIAVLLDNADNSDSAVIVLNGLSFQRRP